jgi:serine/threonine protein kinase
MTPCLTVEIGARQPSANMLKSAHPNSPSFTAWKTVVHRDLKSTNIKVTTEGVVKVLDSGLAAAVQGKDRDSAVFSASPTVT